MANHGPEVMLAERAAQLMKDNEQLRAELAERKRTEEALRLSEQRLRLAVRASNTGLWDWDAQTDEVYFSPEWKAQIGYEDHELENRIGEWEDRLHPDDRERVLSDVKAYLADPRLNYEVEFRLRHKDGSYRWILARASLLTDDLGKPQRMRGAHVDITERKRADEALRTSERLYRTLAHNFPNGGVALFDRELRYMIADGADLDRVALSKDMLEGKTIWEVFSPEVSKVLEPVYRRALAGTSTVEEIPLRGRVYLRHAIPISDDRGEIFAGMVMTQDITERKRAERGLLLLQTITQSISQAEDLDSALQVVLRSVCEATGWIFGQAWVPARGGASLECSSAWHCSDEGLEGFRAVCEGRTFSPGTGLPGRVWVSKRPVWLRDATVDMNFPRAAEAQKAGLKSAVGIPVLAGDEVVLVIEFFVRQPMEEEADLIDLISAVAAELGLVIQGKRAQEALRQKELEYRNLVETVQVIVWRADARTFQFSFVSKEAETLLGYPAEQWNEATFWRDHVHPDDVDWAVALCTKATEEKRDHQFEYRMIAADGRVVWLRDIVRIVVEKDDVPELVGVMVDITERKLAEEARHQSETKFSTIFETIPDVVMIVRLRDWMVLDVNDAWTQHTGYLKSERIGTTNESLDLMVDPGARSAIVEALLETGVIHNLEGEYRIKDGSLCYGLMSARLIELDGEQCAVSIIKNITELKEAVEALRRSEERYRLIVENQTEFIVKWLPDGTRTFVNESYCRYFGMTEEECLGTSFFPLVAPEFREAIRHKTASLTPKAPAYTEEHLSIVPSGQCWQQWTNRGIFDDAGQLIELLSTGRDITDRKQTEEALTQSEAHYRALVENTPDIVARYDRDCRFRFVNAAVAQVSEIKPEDFVGRSLSEAGLPDEQARFREEVIRNVFETQTAFETEVEAMNGRAVFEWRVYPEFDERGSIQTVLSINRDITKRRRAEEQLRQSREQLRALSSHLQSVREEERTRIAREVHDELGQALTALKLDLYALRRSITKEGDRDPDRLLDKVKSMSSLIDTTIQSVRRIATELRPGILDDLGLVAAIEWQANDFQARTGISCEVASSVEYLELDRDRATAAFRIFQETLTNIARHAAASRVEIELKRDHTSLVLEVKDNGKGIKASDITASRSLGLLGMRERAQLLGGDLMIAGATGAGTLVTVSIPL